MDRNSPFTTKQEKLRYFKNKDLIESYEAIDKCFREHNIIQYCDGECITFAKTCTEIYLEDEPHKKCELIKIDDISKYMSKFGATIKYDENEEVYSDRRVLRYYYHDKLYEKLGLFEIYRQNPEYFT